MTPQQRMDTFRALRDSAMAVLQADLAMVQQDVALRSPTGRVADRAREATFDIMDEALEFAGEHRAAVISGVTFAGIAGVLWLARETMFEWLAELLADEDDADAYDDHPASDGYAEHGEPACARMRSHRDTYSGGEH